jgi:hypothetical protein
MADSRIGPRFEETLRRVVDLRDHDLDPKAFDGEERLFLHRFHIRLVRYRPAASVSARELNGLTRLEAKVSAEAPLGPGPRQATAR